MGVTRALGGLAALMALGATPALADGTSPEPRLRSDSAILAHVDRDRIDSSWLSGQLDHLHLHRRRGFAYTHAIDNGDRDLRLSVQGPAVGRKRTVGLGFELRF